MVPSSRRSVAPIDAGWCSLAASLIRILLQGGKTDLDPLLSVISMNRGDGVSEIEGKAAKGSGERVGKGASFKSAEPVRGSLRQGGSAV